MAIRTVVTRGYGNGTFNGTIALVVTHGYSIKVTGVPFSLVGKSGFVGISGGLVGKGGAAVGT